MFEDYFFLMIDRNICFIVFVTYSYTRVQFLIYNISLHEGII